MGREYSVVACLLLIIGLVNTVSPVYSTPPSRMVVFVNRDELTNITKKYFGADISTQVQKVVDKSVDSRAPLLNPYGASFVSVDGYYVVTEILRKIWTETIRHSNAKRFEDFLKVVNIRPVVRGAMSTPDYSGCLLILFSLEEKNERLYLISRQSAHQFKGCWPTDGRRYEISTRTLFE